MQQQGVRHPPSSSMLHSAHQRPNLPRWQESFASSTGNARCLECDVGRFLHDCPPAAIFATTCDVHRMTPISKRSSASWAYMKMISSAARAGKAPEMPCAPPHLSQQMCKRPVACMAAARHLGFRSISYDSISTTHRRPFDMLSQSSRSDQG
jgi:hypothetical protein